MIAIGEKVDNKIAYMKGTIDTPVITRVVEIDIQNQTILSYKRSEIYEAEQYGIQQKTSAIFTRYNSFDLRYQQRSEPGGRNQNVRNNNQSDFGRSGSSRTARRVKEILFDEKGNEVSRKYSRELNTDGMTAEEIWEECICDSFGDMNIFAGEDAKALLDKVIPEVKKAASESK